MHHDVTAFIELLLIASLVAVVLQRVRLPYTVALVAVGIGLGALNVIRGVEISPELVLTIFLPGLLFESAQHIHLRDFLADARVILTLAVPGVALCVLLAGAGVYFGFHALGIDVGPRPFVVACLIGGMVAATDPISVVGLFKSLKVNERLGLLLEGESLFNDGTAVVLFAIILELATGTPLTLADGVRQFLAVAVGGTALGLLGGLIVERLLRTTHDHLIEIGLTVVLAYGVFLLAENFHVSGVIAVVVAGMVNGNLGVHSGINAFSRVALFSFWEFAAFVINSMVFLITGLSVHLAELWQDIGAVLVTAAAVLAARAVGIYALTPVAAAFGRKPIPLAWRHVLFWGGLRGALSIVLALSLPHDFPHRTLLVHTVFGVVVLSVFGQGLTMGPLLRRLGLAGSGGAGGETLLRARIRAHRAALDRLASLLREQHISTSSHDALHAHHAHAIAELEAELDATLHGAATGGSDRAIAELELRKTMRAAILEGYHRQELSAEGANALIEELDAAGDEVH